MNTPKQPVLYCVRLVRTVMMGFWLVVAAQSAEESKRNYDLSAGDAATALRKFSEASGCEILFAAEIVRGVRTSGVQGEFTALAALNHMLAGTSLYALQDPRTGAFAVRQRPEAAPVRTSPDSKHQPQKPPEPPKTMNRKNPVAIVLAWFGIALAPAHPAISAEGTSANVSAHQSGTGAITGRVLNNATGQYLRSAVVTIVGTNLSTESEYGGAYTLTGVPAGEVRLSVSFAGLNPVETTVRVGAGQTLNYDVAMTSGADTSSIVRLDAFRVVTEREGNYKAIQQQKAALEIKSVVASDAFGDVSEGNVGEFLKFMPGLMLDFNDADVNAVSVSGMHPKYAMVMMDGMPVASAGSASIATGRAFELEHLSISSIETVELSKTPTPDVSGSALAGVINLRSKGAFDRRGRQIRWSAGAEMSSHNMTLKRTQGPADRDTYKLHPNFSLEFSDVFLGEKLGVLAGVSSTVTLVEQNIINHNYAFDNDATNNATEIPPLRSYQMTDAPKITHRTNYNLRLDYKLSSNLHVWGRIDHNKYATSNIRRDLFFFPGDAINGPRPTDPRLAGTEYSHNSQTTTNGTIQLSAGFSFNKSGSLNTVSSGASYRRGAFRADVQGQVARARSIYDDLPYGYFTSSTAQVTGLGLRLNRGGKDDPALSITQLSGPDWRSLSSYPGSANANVRFGSTSGKEDILTAKADFRYDRQFGEVPVHFKWGGDVGHQTRETQGNGILNITYLGADRVANTGDDGWAFEPYRLRNLSGGNLQDVPMPERYALARIYGANPERFTRPTDAQILQANLTTRNKVREQVDSLYQQTIVKVSKKITLAPGVRFERTRSLGIGPTDLGDRYAKNRLTGNPTANIPTNTVEYVRARYGSSLYNRSDYHTWLKYLHATYRHSDTLVFRASFNNSITRPDLNNLSGGVTLNETVIPPTAAIPNAGIKPESGRNFFASAEYYFPKGGGLLTLSAARRDISNLILSNTVDVPIGDTFPNGEGLDLGGYRVTTSNNVGRAHLSTLELSYRQNLLFLPGMWKAVSIFGNYTLLRYDNYENFRRPHHLANGGVSFDHRGFSLRWNITWTPTYRRNAVTPATGYGLSWAEHVSHDAQLAYRFSRGMSVFVNGRNVFNRQRRSLFSSGENTILQNFADNGTVWTFGVRGQF